MLNHTNITTSLWIMAVSAVSLSLPACALQQQNAQTQAQAQNTSKAVSNYSDCSQINFSDIDGRELTREELIKRMDDDFEANLSKSEKCMAEAVASGAGRLGGAGGSGAGTGAGAGSNGSSSAAGSSNTSADSSSGTDSQQSQQNQSATGASSAEQQKGKGGQGSSSVCDAVKQGLTSATTDAEKQHFRGLMEQYGCK